MNLPFTTEQFLGVFRDYNLSVWPAQIVALLVAASCIALALRGPAGSRLAATLLALLWLWMGIVYHGIFFARINPAATIFAALFVLEAVLIVHAGAIRRSLRFQPRRDLAGSAGVVLMAYALLVYPILGAVSSHAYPQAPTFGLPCPTTIFTFGLLLWADEGSPRYLAVIPALWSVLGLSAALSLGIVEDIGLIVSAIVATALLLRRSPKAHAVTHS